MSQQLSESQLSLLQKGRLRGKVTLHTVTNETYEFEAKIALEHKTVNSCVIRIDNDVYPVASPVESIFSFERRWDRTIIFLLAILFELLVVSLYLNINLWYTFEFRPDAGGYSVLLMSFATTFLAAYYAVKQQVLSIRLKEVPLAPTALYISENDIALDARIRAIKITQTEIIEILKFTKELKPDQVPALEEALNEAERHAQVIDDSANIPIIEASNVTPLGRKSWKLKAKTHRGDEEIIYRSSFDIPALPKANQKALDQLRKVERIPDTEKSIGETLELKVLEYLQKPDKNVYYLLQSLLYYLTVGFSLIEVISNKNMFFRSKNSALRDNINRYTQALADQRLIAQDINPQLTTGSKRRAKASLHFKENWWIYAVAFACAIMLFIYISIQQGWF